jgi:hypothetical protein
MNILKEFKIISINLFINFVYLNPETPKISFLLFLSFLSNKNLDSVKKILILIEN